MANKNTKQARAKGYPSKLDMDNNGDKVFSGSCCDTAWNNKNSNKRARKVYKRQPSFDD
jgi:hypothetical protein